MRYFMPARKVKTYHININGQEIELSLESIDFFLKETDKKFVTKKSLEKFYNNLTKFFTKD